MENNRKKSESTGARSNAIEGLTQKQSIALRALIRGASVSEAARRAHVRRATVSNWLHHDPLFGAQYAFLQHELDVSLTQTLKHEDLRTVKFLAKVRDNSTLKMADRIRAATSLLQHVHVEAAPLGLSDEESTLLRRLALENSTEAKKDRIDHRQSSLDAFDNSAKGLRLGKLCHRQRELKVNLEELHARLDEAKAQLRPEDVKTVRGRVIGREHIDELQCQIIETGYELAQVIEDAQPLAEERRRIEEMPSANPEAFDEIWKWAAKKRREIGDEAFEQLLREADPDRALGHAALFGAAKLHLELKAAQEARTRKIVTPANQVRAKSSAPLEPADAPSR